MMRTALLVQPQERDRPVDRALRRWTASCWPRASRCRCTSARSRTRWRRCCAKFGGRFEPGRRVHPERPVRGRHPPAGHLPDQAGLPGRRARRVLRHRSPTTPTSAGGWPGGNASDSTEIYQEGLRLPPIKLYDAGRPNEAVFEHHRARTSGCRRTCSATCARSWRPATSASAASASWSSAGARAAARAALGRSDGVHRAPGARRDRALAGRRLRVHRLHRRRRHRPGPDPDRA